MNGASPFVLRMRDSGAGWCTARLLVGPGDSLSWQDDDRLSGSRRLSDIRQLRLWCEKSKIARPVGHAEIRFSDGRTIAFHGGLSNGAPDAERARTYRAALLALHAALRSAPGSGVTYRRGLADGSPVRGWALGLTLAAMVAVAFWVLGSHQRADTSGPVRVAMVAFALGGLAMAAVAGQAAAGRTYDPGDIPSELVPP